jgi:hypothetical protein
MLSPSRAASAPSCADNYPADSSGVGRSVGPSSPSSQGSASRLASIINAFEELDIESHRPHYVVLRGTSPGVYASRCLSFSHDFGPLLTVKSSTSALAATGSHSDGVCCLVASKDLANAMFVAKSMAKEVEYL